MAFDRWLDNQGPTGLIIPQHIKYAFMCVCSPCVLCWPPDLLSFSLIGPASDRVHPVAAGPAGERDSAGSQPVCQGQPAAE